MSGSVAPPPNSSAGVVIKRRVLGFAPVVAAKQAERSEAVVDLAVALNEARQRAAGDGGSAKKISPEPQPSVAPKVEAKPDVAADQVLPDRSKAVDGSIMMLKAAALENQRELSAAAPGRRWIDFQRERDISDIPGTYINAVVGSFHRVLAPLLPLYKLSTGIISITTITIGITL